jgi:hypothetical protein
MFVTVWLTGKGPVAAALPAALLVTGWLTGLWPVTAPLKTFHNFPILKVC